MRRRPNFTDDEKNALVDAVVERYELIRGHFADSLTPNGRDDAWKEVLAAVNYVSEVTRDLAEVKKKYQALKRVISSKAASDGLFVDGDIRSINWRIKEEVEDDDDGRIADATGSENDSNQSPGPIFDAVKTSSNLNSTPQRKINRGIPPKRITARRIAPKEMVASNSPANAITFNSSAGLISLGPSVAECSNSSVAASDRNESLTAQLKRIADLMEERNRIERDKLELKRHKLELNR